MSKKRVQMLTAEEEIRLLKAYHVDNDIAARNLLIESYMPRAKKLAEKFARKGTASLSDLIQEASIALANAIDNFDMTKGARISTLATYYIRAALMRHAMDFHSIVRTGTNLPDKKVFMNLRRMVADLHAKTGGQPLTDADRAAFARELRVRPDVILRMEPRIFAADVSIAPTDTIETEDGTFLTQDGVIAVEGEQRDVARAHDHKKAMELIWSVVRGSYEGRDLEIISARLEGEMTPAKYAALVAKHGITIERIRQIQRGALAKIRESMVMEGYSGLGDFTSADDPVF